MKNGDGFERTEGAFTGVGPDKESDVSSDLDLAGDGDKAMVSVPEPEPQAPEPEPEPKKLDDGSSQEEVDALLSSLREVDEEHQATEPEGRGEPPASALDPTEQPTDVEFSLVDTLREVDEEHQEAPHKKPPASAPKPKERPQADFVDTLMGASGEGEESQSSPPAPEPEEGESGSSINFDTLPGDGTSARADNAGESDEDDFLIAPPPRRTRSARRGQTRPDEDEDEPREPRRPAQTSGRPWRLSWKKILIFAGILAVLLAGIGMSYLVVKGVQQTFKPTSVAPSAPAPGAPVAPGAPATPNQPASGPDKIQVQVNGVVVDVPLDVNVRVGVRQWYDPGPGMHVERVDLGTVDPQAIRQVIANQLGKTVVVGPTGATIAPTLVVPGSATPTAAPLFDVPASEIARELGGRVDRLEDDVTATKADIGTLKSDVAGLKTDVGELKGASRDFKGSQRSPIGSPRAGRSLRSACVSSCCLQ